MIAVPRTMRGAVGAAAFAVAAAVASLGCGATSAEPRATARATTPPPSTSDDPPPWAPLPEPAPSTGDAVGVVTSGAREQARDVTLGLLRALHAADATALEERLADTLAPVAPSFAQAPPVARRSVVDAMLEGRNPGAEGLAVAEVFDLSRVRTLPITELYPTDLPLGLERSDVAVEVVVLPAGQRLLRNVGRAVGGRLIVVVRPGPDARVVSLR